MSFAFPAAIAAPIIPGILLGGPVVGVLVAVLVAAVIVAVAIRMEPREWRRTSERPRLRVVAEPWGDRTPFSRGESWPVRVDMFLEHGVSEEDVDLWAPSASILHSNGDGQDIAVKDGRIVGVRGRAGDRVNHGRLGPKDLYGWQANNSADRLTRPLVIAVTGIVLIIAGSGAARGLGILLIGAAGLVVLANALARLALSSQEDRAREARARRWFTRTGR